MKDHHDVAQLPLVLCVDDERQVLEGLETNLRKLCRVLSATSGAEALAILEHAQSIAVIVSDMRMPKMNGAEFLARSRQVAPDTTRILLTGQTDLDVAIDAVNEGQVFRFLTKPCPPKVLEAAVTAALEQHRLVTSEKVLLEQTLTGSIKALMDVLALANPVGFGRATRIKALSQELSVRSGVYELWSIEMTAMLSQIGCVSLPHEVSDKIARGAKLNAAEDAMVQHLPVTALQLIAEIPRLDGIRSMLTRLSKPRSEVGVARPGDTLATAAEIVRLAADYELLDARGISTHLALQTIQHRGDRYEPRLVKVLEELKRSTADDPMLLGVEVEVTLHDLTLGMRIAHDVVLPNGVVLVARGYQVTHGLLTRIENLRTSGAGLPEKVTVVLPC